MFNGIIMNISKGIVAIVKKKVVMKERATELHFFDMIPPLT